MYCGNIYFVNNNEDCNQKGFKMIPEFRSLDVLGIQSSIYFGKIVSVSNWKSACDFTTSSSNYFGLFVQLLIACWFGAESLIFTPLIPPKKHWNHFYSCELFDILNLIFTSCCGKCPIVYCVHANSLKANNWFFSPMNEQYHPLVTITNNYPKSRTCKVLLLQNLSN